MRAGSRTRIGLARVFPEYPAPLFAFIANPSGPRCCRSAAPHECRPSRLWCRALLSLCCWCYKTQNGALCPFRVPTNINETETVSVQVGMEVADGKVLAGSRQQQKENREHGGTAIPEASLNLELTAVPVLEPCLSLHLPLRHSHMITTKGCRARRQVQGLPCGLQSARLDPEALHSAHRSPVLLCLPVCDCPRHQPSCRLGVRSITT